MSKNQPQSMLRFFRRLRQRLINENRLGKYLLYAAGEIILVFFGILIALNVNNWNEKRKLDAQFATTIEQLYNSILFDVEKFEVFQSNLRDRINNLNYLLKVQEGSVTTELIGLAFFSFANNNIHYSETPFYLEKLVPDPTNVIHTELLKEINNYVNRLQTKAINLNQNAYQMLIDAGIAYPGLDESTPFLEFQTGPENYSPDHLRRFTSLLNDPQFRAEIGTLKTMMRYQTYEYRVKIGAGRALVDLISNYFPDVQILYSDVGIIGTSIDGFDDVGATSTPMLPTDVNNSIWEITLYLKEGRVKFRCRDSWAQNWGGDTFPEGQGYHDGPDINVDAAGMYHIKLDLSDRTYKFTKLED